MEQQQGFSIMHSFPFITDGPAKISNKLKHRHSIHSSVPQPQPPQTVTPHVTKQVPPGVIHIKPTWKPVRLDEKPPFSYATLIAHAILSSENRRLTLNEIYQWISKHYPCYSMKDHRWQNSIRHNLSLQKAFVKLERDANTPSGKGCYWTLLPGYEQQFIDNLLKRGMGSSAPTTASNSNSQGRKHSSSVSSGSTTTSHKQFRKFMDASANNSHNHLFTIFRMNPTNNSDTSSNNKKTKKSPHSKSVANKKAKREVRQQQPLMMVDPMYDSDCDSGVDLDCEILPKKEGVSIPQLPSTTTTAAAPLPQQQQQQLPLDSFLMENSMFVPDHLLLTQQPNGRPQSCFLDSMMDTSSFYDPIDYWNTTTSTQQAHQSQLFDFTTSTPQQGLVDYYNETTTPLNNYISSLNHNPYLQHQPQQDFFLYNDFC